MAKYYFVKTAGFCSAGHILCLSLVQHLALPHAVLVSLMLFWHYTVSVIFMDGPFREVPL